MKPFARPHTQADSRRRSRLASLTALLLTLGSTLHADVVVDAKVTPLGASFRYDLTVTNNETEDLAVVSFSDAPGSDPLIEPSLIVPLGFVGSYDGVLQFIDFLSDTALFPAGGTVGGFHFESLSGPGQFFSTVEALTVNGTPVTGLVQTAIVPEAGSLGAIGTLGGIAAAYGIRRARSAARAA